MKEMTKKLHFYDRYGVEEYYIYDPDRNDWTGLQRVNQSLEVIETETDWISPRLGIRFVMTEETLTMYYPDGSPFLTTVELAQRVEQATQWAEQATQRAEQAAQRAEREAQRAERLADRLRELGIDPDAV
jgi:hypothetical protein